MSTIVGPRMSPVSVSLSGVRWQVAVVPVLLRVSVVVLPVFCSVIVTSRVRPGVTSVIHVDLYSQDPGSTVAPEPNREKEPPAFSRNVKSTKNRPDRVLFRCLQLTHA